MPGSFTWSSTSARATVSDHHFTASLKRVGPEVSSRAATPQPTRPSPLRSQVTGSFSGTRSRSAVSPRSTGMVRTVSAAAEAVAPSEVAGSEPADAGVVTRREPTPGRAARCREIGQTANRGGPHHLGCGGSRSS